MDHCEGVELTDISQECHIDLDIDKDIEGPFQALPGKNLIIGGGTRDGSGIGSGSRIYRTTEGPAKGSSTAQAVTSASAPPFAEGPLAATAGNSNNTELNKTPATISKAKITSTEAATAEATNTEEGKECPATIRASTQDGDIVITIWVTETTHVSTIVYVEAEPTEYAKRGIPRSPRFHEYGDTHKRAGFAAMR